MNDNYSIKDHTHRFAVWTAARAVQRNFTTSIIIKNSIESTELSKLLIDEEIATNNFKNFHIKTCNQLISEFSKHNITASYGQAAKIVAIYIKTAIVLPCKGVGLLSKLAHPPIDRILLKSLPKKYCIKLENWTQLDKSKYWELIGVLEDISKKDFNGDFWRIETFWDIN